MSRQNGGVHNEEIVMPTTTVGIDSVIEKAVGIGIPVGLYAIAVAVSGKRGACAVTHALKLLGCGKMKYGVASLFVISQVSEEVAHMSVKIPSKQALKQRMMDGEEEASVLWSVDQLPVSGDMKQELKKYVHTYCKKRERCEDGMPDEDPHVDYSEIESESESGEWDMPPTCISCGGDYPDCKEICPLIDE